MPEKVSSVLEENIARIRKLFGNDRTVKLHRLQPQAVADVRCCLVFVDGMVDSLRINQSITRPISLLREVPPRGASVMDFLQYQVLQANEAQTEETVEAVLRGLLYGDTVLFVDGCGKALILGSKGFAKRGIAEPAGETYLKGPREGFVEPLLHNLAMLRRRLRTTALKLEYFTLGTVTKTDCCLCYLEGQVDRNALAQLRKRLSGIAIDGVFDSNYIAELVRDARWSPFRTTGTTERPDVVAAKLLEGRIALLVDGSPVALTVPHVFLEQFQSGEDYYVDVFFAGINRVLRVSGFVAAISVLPLYLSLVAFHQAFMPLPLILSVAKARQGVPFPILLEALLLSLAFDILREAGARTPSSVGQSLSVVGGLVIGQAAVDARLVSVPVLIIVAVSSICSLITPKLKAATLLCRTVLMFLAVWFGIYGVLLGCIGILLLLSEQRSFGVSYFAGLPLQQCGSAEDSVIRPPYWAMKRFGRFLADRAPNKRRGL
ncbi:MAG: spore germination protein [Clostridia bacterium]|nr:spore germination protein [Clostridia bacterium]